MLVFLIFFVLCLSLGPIPVVGIVAHSDCDVQQQFSFGGNSSLYNKYQYKNGSGSVVTPLVMDVYGDAHPEIFLPSAFWGRLRALTFDSIAGVLKLLWELPNLIPAGAQISMAKVQSTNQVICSYYSTTEFFCADAATGVPIFVENLGYSICNTNAEFSGFSIERLFSSSMSNCIH